MALESILKSTPVKSLLLGVGGLFLSALPTFGQNASTGTTDILGTQNAAVQGVVRFENTRVSGAEVKFTLLSDTTQVYKDTTDANGLYAINDLATTDVDDENPIVPTNYEIKESWRI